MPTAVHRRSCLIVPPQTRQTSRQQPKGPEPVTTYTRDSQSARQGEADKASDSLRAKLRAAKMCEVRMTFHAACLLAADSVTTVRTLHLGGGTVG